MSVRLEQLLAAATPGRWFYDSYATIHSAELVALEADETGVARVWAGNSGFSGGTASNPPDAALIALAPDMGRLLIDMGEALRKTLNLAVVSFDGDPWYAKDAGIDAESVIASADSLLARLDALGKDSA